jgi:uncharacterized hydrophobic protein (TIGR00341 family)
LKKIEVVVTKKEAPDVEKALKDLGLLYVQATVMVEGEECNSYSALVPDEFAAKAMETISPQLDLRQNKNMISLLAVEGVNSSFMERLKAKAAKVQSAPNPTEKLVESTERYTHLSRDLIAMTILATLIALAGLYLNNVVIIIGGMLIPPMLGPVNALAVNANLGKPKKLITSQITVLVLIATAIITAALTTLLASQFFTIPYANEQITLRIHVTIFDLLIALVIGITAGLSFRVAFSENLLGVVISVALVPPATVAGIELALSNDVFFFGALVLTFVYLFGLEFGCTILLRLMGVSPNSYYKKEEAKRHSSYSIVILAILLAILAAVVYFSAI